jgi:hypothetical protein
MDERKLTLAHRVSSVAERFTDITAFEVRVSVQYFRLAQAVGNHRHNGSDRNAQAANTGQPTHLVRIDGYSCEFQGAASTVGPNSKASRKIGRLGSLGENAEIREPPARRNAAAYSAASRLTGAGS